MPYTAQTIKTEIRSVEARLIELSEQPRLTEREEDEWRGLTKRQDQLRGMQRAIADPNAWHDGVPAPARPARESGTTTAQGAALRMLERASHLSGAAQDRVDRLVRDGDDVWSRWVEVHASEDYETAFGKIVLLGEARASTVMTDAERQAMGDSYHVRAQAEGATTQGGYALPVFIDPSVILTNQQSGNPLLAQCRVEDVTTNVWKGVSAAGVSWSFDPEAAEVSDDSITLAQPSVTVAMARGFIPFSIEVGQDWPGFQSEMARLLSEGYDELVASKMATGTGTNEPRGLLTALSANTNDQVVVTTDGAFGQEDVYKVWEAVPMKYRRNAAWFMSTSVMDKIRAMGDQTKWHAQTVQLPAGAIDMLFNRPVYEQPYFADFTGTTGAANLLVVGDPSNYVVARRAGMTVEVVPHLFGGSGRPSGQRGLFAFGRIGANSVNDLGFRILQNQ
jgi:HK97 family phage major capsid protein